MPISENDPRVFFAAERTLLAWLRTGLAIMAIGFVVSRFGLFLRLVAGQSNASSANHVGPSAILGIAFIIVGTLTIVLSAIQHQRFIATLPQTDLPPSYSKGFALGLSLLIGALGIALVAYLIVTQP